MLLLSQVVVLSERHRELAERTDINKPWTGSHDNVRAGGRPIVVVSCHAGCKPAPGMTSTLLCRFPSIGGQRICVCLAWKDRALAMREQP